MLKPTVDVVIPTTGRSSLQRAVRSVRGQAGVEIRLHVVLDAPANRAQLLDYLSEDEIIVTAGGIGGAAARNAGLRASTNRYLAYLDDDDWWEPEKLSLQVREAERVGASLVLCGGWMESESTARRVPTNPPEGFALGDYMLLRPNLRYGFGLVQSSCILIDREAIAEVEWDAQMAKHQDWDYVMRIAELNPVVGFVNRPMVHIQEGSANSISKSRSWQASRFWYEKHKDRIGPRARGDFVMAQIFRAALAAGDGRGVVWASREATRSRPHVAAIVVGSSGVVERARNMLDRNRASPDRRAS